MTASIVQSSGKQSVLNSSTNPTYTLTGVTAGNAIIVLVNYLDGSGTTILPAGVADAGGSYSIDEQVKANNQNGSHTSTTVYSFFNAAAGSHTITLTRGTGATGVYWVYDVLEVSGLPTTNSKDTSSTTNYGASSGPVNVGGSTLSAINGFAIALSVNVASDNPPALYPPEVGMGGSGTQFTGLFTGSSDYPSGSAGYLVPTLTSSYGADFGGISSTSWAAIFVYYTPAMVANHDRRRRGHGY